MAYYSLLKTKRHEEIMNIPITAIGISESTLKAILNCKKIAVNGVSKSYYQTVGDLVTHGIGELESLLSSLKPRYDVLREWVQEIEEKLARIGLKIEDSEFTIGDIRIKELGLDDETSKFLQSCGKIIKTLDDVIILDYEKLLVHVQRNNAKKQLKQLEQALERYGLKIEESNYRLRKYKRFPLTKYYGYFSQEFIDKIESRVKLVEQRTKELPKIDLSVLSKEELLSLDVRYLSIGAKTVRIFAENNIIYIKDVVSTGEKKLKNLVNSFLVTKIENELATYGVIVNGSNVKIVNGKAVRERFSIEEREGVTENAPAPVDVLSLNDVDREKFLSIKISEFGFSPAIEKLFDGSEKYKTIGDIISVSRWQLSKDIEMATNYQVNKIQKALSRYNLKFSEFVKGSQAIAWRLINREKFIEGFDFANASQEEKESFKNKKVSDIGFGEKMLETCTKLGVSTVGELLERSIAEINDIETRENVVKAIIFILGKYNLKLRKSERKDKKGQSLMRLKNINEMTQEEREAFMKQSIKVLGVSPKSYEKLCINSLYTVKDLTTVSYSAICKILRAQSARKTLKAAMDKCGLSFGGSTRPWDTIDRKYEAANDIVEIQRFTLENPSVNTQHHEEKSKEIKNNNIASDNVGLLETSIDVLDIGNMAKMFFKSYNMGRLGDIATADIGRIKAILSFRSIEYRKLEDSLAQYGLLLGMTKEEAQKVAEENQRAQKNENSEAVLKIKERDMETILAKDIRHITSKPLIISRLRESGIKTVRDLCNITRPDLVKILKNNQPHVSSIMRTLKGYDLSLRFVRVLDDTYTQRTIQNVNINEMNDSEKQILLCRSISELGIKKTSFENLIKARIFTIGDLIDAGNKGISAAVKSPMHIKIIYEALENIGVVFKKEKKTPRQPKQIRVKEQKKQAKRKVEVFNVGELPEDKAQAFLDGGLNQLPLTLQMIQKLESVGYKTVRDLISSNVTEFKSRGFSYSNVNFFKSILSKFGLTIQPAQSRKGVKKSQNKKFNIPVFNFNEATEEKKQEFLQKPVTAIGISNKLSAKLSVIGVNAIQDFLSMSYSKLVKAGICGGTVDSIRKRLLKFGITFASERKVNVAIAPFSFYEADDETKGKFLNSSIKNIGLTNQMVEKLSAIGIITVQDVLNKTFTDFKRLGFNQSNVLTIRKRLSNFGLDIKSRQYGVASNGKGGRDKNPQYPIFDFKEANNEQRQKFLSSPISSLGLTNGATEKFNKISIMTIGDVINFSLSELVNLGIDTNMASKISKKLKEYKLGLKNNRAKVKISLDIVDVSQMNAESREVFISKPLETLRLTNTTIEKLKQANITTIKELIDCSGAELRQFNISYNSVLSIKKSLALFGLSLASTSPKTIARSRQRNKRAKKAKFINVHDLSEEAREEFMQRTVKELGLSDMLAGKLIDAGFITIQDLVDAKRKTFKDVGLNDGNIRTITAKLTNYGLNLVAVKTVKSQEKYKKLVGIDDQLKESGITALEMLDDKYFVTGSKEIEELKDYVREYFTWKTQQLIFSSATEEILDYNLSKIEKEKQEFERIMEEKRKVIISKDKTCLIEKKMGAAAKLKREIFDIINKYHHAPMIMKDALREIKARNHGIIDDVQTIKDL